ncbi:MAG: PAS domain S-box protein [Chitinophagales bacterium]
MRAFYDSRSRIKIIFVLTAAGLLSVSIVSFIRIKSLDDTARIINRTNLVKLQLERIISFLKDAETGQRGYLLIHDSVFLYPYSKSLENLDESFDILDELIAENGIQVQNMHKLRRFVDTRLQYLNTLIKQNIEYPITTQQLVYGKALMDSARRQVDVMLGEEDATLKTRSLALENAGFITPLVVILLILFSLAVLIASYAIITGELRRSEHLEQQLSSRNQLIETILDTSVDQIAALDKDLNYILMNKNTEVMLGMKKEQAIGEKITDLLPEMAENAMYKNISDGLKGEMVHIPQYYSEANKRFYENFYMPLKNPDESVYGILLISHDITSLTEASENLKKANDSLRERNQLIETLIDSSTDLIAGFDKDMRITIFNKKASDIIGLRKEDVINKTVPDILPAVTCTENYQNILKALKGFPTHQSLTYSKALKMWLENSIIPLKSNDSITGVLYFGHNLSEVMAAQEKLNESNKQLEISNNELKRSEQRYLSMVSDVEDYAIIFLSKDGTVENWNKGAEKQKGYKEDEILGKNFAVFYTRADQSIHLPEKLISEAKSHGKVSHVGWSIKKDGSMFWAGVSITALYDDDDNFLGFSELTRDLTERKLTEDQMKTNARNLELKNRELEKINEDLASFAYVSSHDLQEPLRKIQTFASRIVETELDNLSDSGKDYFSRMQAAAERMQNLIKDLLAYSRTNSTERKFEKTDLNTLVEEVKNDLKEVIQEKNAIIETTNLCEANIIPFQFRQLMQNLISNSLKFAKPGKQPHIVIQDNIVLGSALRDKIPEPEKNYCHISVKDNGIGFDPKFRLRIFEVFQRLHGIDKYQGTGIGLAICKKIVDNHQGIITATSAPDEGATFDIYIPAADNN